MTKKKEQKKYKKGQVIFSENNDPETLTLYKTMMIERIARQMIRDGFIFVKE